MHSEKELQIHPIVAESLIHNTRALSNYQSLVASLLGVAAGILGLESYTGFLFYTLFSLLATGLFHAIRVAPSSAAAGHSPVDTSRYYRSSVQFWTGGLTSGVAGFILTWTLLYGLIRA